MDLFKSPKPTVDPDQLVQVKSWVYDSLDLALDIPVSISQLLCHEPDCPPLETVIAVMTQPPQQYKLHKGLSDITLADVQCLKSESHSC